MNDSEIIGLYLRRDESAISETSSRYGSYLWRIANNVLSDEFESEECVNDTYLRTWQAIPPEVPLRLSAFLARITRNLALDRYRARSAEKRGASEATLSLDELGECIGDEDKAMESREIARCINQLLSESKERDRRAFMLRYFHEESIADVATALGMSESLVKTTLFRMRQRLKNILEGEGVYL